MTAPTGLPHLEQAKMHIWNADYIMNFESPADPAVRQLTWALDEVVRHLEAP